jgi:spore maturation protein CgeB
VGPRGLEPFDVVLSFSGGKTLDALERRLGARRAVALYGTVDPDAHRPSPPAPMYHGELSYLGAYAADRQPTLEELFLEPARRLERRRFVLGGSLYPPDFPVLANVWHVRRVAPEEHPAFYSSSSFTLSVTRRAMLDSGFCPSGRLFEAAACGTPVITDEWEGIDRFFEPGKEILIARTAHDVVRALGLSRRERSRIAAAARARVLRDHTAAARAGELVRIARAARVGAEA